ncbi:MULTISPECIES: DUF6279 family lipoprotein [Marinobacter]|jgi:hypothetical protein|uniref:Putative lipoprotein n=1 Tax=Marinobacter manganoxydans MnI7-9 TaxID=1094979 RepID=G6YXD6_9GAMM|nr:MULTISPECIES: DUF6279 family lipoprotein [Marinobacter]EHJ02998.1 putative lipoprotein [Marinobacter manganoxydans MnI7-9]MAK50410.1 DUF3549 domain-containing protein [Marinobacter sp.]PTB94607.1 DUF3549 domain-containing protein [Marinobacter sp. B9-2]|tara:strand:+ start:1936 stop:2814 length:879 start_codon:yes stop_codon:yes gene_type:complete
MDTGHESANSFAKSFVLILVLAFGLVGCSSTKVAYRYADWGIVWWVEDYVSLTADQKQQLNNDIAQLRQWHCSAELPRYQAWLDELESDVSNNPPDQATVEYHQQQLFSFFPSLLERATPVATNLLSSLSDEQVQELADNMAQSQREMEEEFLADSPEATAEARADRTAERVERWLGELNSEQRNIVRQWSANRGAQTEIWLQGRRNWQVALLEILEGRDEPTFEAELEYLILNSEEVRGEAYKAMMAESRVAMASLMHDLILAGDNTTLAHLQNRAVELNNDFEALTCSPA